MVKAARRVELEYFEAKGVWERRKREECLRSTDKNPISVRWADISKGDGPTPNYRSRLVARDVWKKGEGPTCTYTTVGKLKDGAQPSRDRLEG